MEGFCMKINSTKLLTLKKWIFFLIFCVSELCVSFFIGIYSSLVLKVIHISVFSTLLILYMIKSSHSLKYYGIHLQYPISQIYCSITTFLVLLLLYYQIADFDLWRYHELRLLQALSVSYFFQTLLTAIYIEFVWHCFFLSLLKELTTETFSLIFTSILCGVLYFPMNFSINLLIQTISFSFVMGYLRCKSPEKFTLFSLTLIHIFWNLLH